MNFNGLLEVVRFELLRNLKRPSFWLSILLVPVLASLYILFASANGASTQNAFEDMAKVDAYKIALLDESGFLYPKQADAATLQANFDVFTQILNAKSLSRPENLESGKDAVKTGAVDLFYYLPADFAKTRQAQIFVRPQKPSFTSDYSAAFKNFLTATALSRLPEADRLVLSKQVNFDTTTYDPKDQHVIDFSENISRAFMPILTLALFYFLLVTFGNRIVTSVTEEKENRISELLLVKITPITLILGKVISLMLLGLLEVVLFATPILIASQTGLLSRFIPLESFHLQLDPLNVAAWLALVLAAFFMLTALLIFIGAFSATAKEASGFSSIVIFVMLVPLFAMSAFISPTPNLITHFLTFFPVTAPVSLMLRGIMGTLDQISFIIGLVLLVIFAFAFASLGAKIFARFAVNYDSAASFLANLRHPRLKWKK